jgi:hypothetical protein
MGADNGVADVRGLEPLFDAIDLIRLRDIVKLRIALAFAREHDIGSGDEVKRLLSYLRVASRKGEVAGDVDFYRVRAAVVATEAGERLVEFSAVRHEPPFASTEVVADEHQGSSGSVERVVDSAAKGRIV